MPDRIIENASGLAKRTAQESDGRRGKILQYLELRRALDRQPAAELD